MTLEQRFGYSFEVSLEFLAHEPAQAQRWLDARRTEFAKQEFANGPRGGTYRLTTPPDDWRVSIDPFWHPNTAMYLTKRSGRYVRPGRVRLRSQPITFGTFELPVTGGKVMLPDGRVVETESQMVSVPVPPAFDD